jgi:ribosomal protein L11 methyltransferase
MSKFWKEFSFFVPFSKTEVCRFHLASLTIKGWEEKEEKQGVQFRMWLRGDEENSLKKILEALSAQWVEQKKIKDEMWGKNWKRFFKPILVGEKICVLPSWEKLPRASNRISIKIHPGMAFGTGDHPTTRLCLEALEKETPKGGKWLDFGTGSGILAIGLAKLGASKILAIDEDELALESAWENAKRNRVEKKIYFLKSNQPPTSDVFDGIVSNILAEPLADFANDFLRILKPGKPLILSGITSEKAVLVKKAYQKFGNIKISYQSGGDWVCLKILKK